MSDRRAATEAQTSAPGRRLAVSAMAALGVVFGDLGTSPLYTLQTAIKLTGQHPTPEVCLGLFSLIVWTLVVTVTVKYCVLVMRADNHGEGGILALMSLVGANRLKGRAAVLTTFGLLGAALLYGDGVITPAISVLSALEGLKVVTDSFTPFIPALAVAILAGLFAVQSVGTATIGRAFGPIMLAWFLVIAVMGLGGVIGHPAILAGLDPRRGLAFLAHSGFVGFALLGAVFLCVTGAEALYADMGHFGRAPIRWGWAGLVLPALLLNYAGQAALMMAGAGRDNPFFELAPLWAVYPLVALATLATIIASQAIITGAFSMTRQAIQLRWMPAMKIRQTSAEAYGQIYVPVVNALMAVATIGVTLGFKTSDNLAGAYGTAVSTTMLLTTGLLFTAMRRAWRWPLWLTAATSGLFLVVDTTFFGANLLKLFDGGWVPLTLGAVIFLMMMTWRAGADATRARGGRQSQSLEGFAAELRARGTPRVPGVAVFLTRELEGVPALMTQHVRQMGALHETVVALTIDFLEQPRASPEERLQVRACADGIWHARARYGFIEIPDIPAALGAAPAWNGQVDIAQAIYFANRDLVLAHPGHSPLGRLRLQVFGYLYRNAVRAVDRFKLPPANVVETARQLEL